MRRAHAPASDTHAHAHAPRQRAGTAGDRRGIYHDAAAIVEAEYAGDLQLPEIAHRVAASRRQLQRAYAEAGGTTFSEHLTAIRMERAAELLRGRVFVRDVARRVGYRQPAYFAKVFRSHHGVTPSAFRARAEG
jgi:AraC family transcriptional regulator of adaptative response / methylphosphotriester-DNA alkyltransferase methyltransferase